MFYARQEVEIQLSALIRECMGVPVSVCRLSVYACKFLKLVTYIWVYPKCAFTDMESISSLSEHTKRLSKLKKKPSNLTQILIHFKIQYPELPDPSYVHCPPPPHSPFNHPSTTPASPKTTVPTHSVKANFVTNLSVHLLQETLRVIRVTVQFTPLYLTGSGGHSASVTDMPVHLKHFQTQSKSN